MKTTCIIHVRGGVIQNLPDIEKACYTLKEGRYLMEVFEHNRRSNQQNRYYFGLVVPLIQKGLNDMGHDFTKEEVHEFLKSKFNFAEIVNEQTGQYEVFPRSTTRLNKEGFCEYIEKIQRFAAEFLGVVIPGPGEQMKIEM